MTWRDLWRRNRQAALAAAAAAVTGVYLYMYLVGLQQRIEVVAAARDLAEGERVDATAVRLVSLPLEARHPQAIARPEDALGRYLRGSVAAGETLLRHRLSDADRHAAMRAALRPEQRAMFLPLPPERGLGGALRPRDRVDLIFVPDPGLAVDTGAAARLVLRDVEVLDVRSERGGDLPQPEAESGAGVLIALTLSEAERVAYALERGKVYAALIGYAPGSDGQGRTDARR